MEDQKEISIHEENLYEFLRFRDRRAPLINGRQVVGILWDAEFIGRFLIHCRQQNPRQYINDNIERLRNTASKPNEIQLGISFDRIIAYDHYKQTSVLDADLLNLRYCTCNHSEKLLTLITRHERSDYGETYALTAQSKTAILQYITNAVTSFTQSSCSSLSLMKLFDIQVVEVENNIKNMARLISKAIKDIYERLEEDTAYKPPSPLISNRKWLKHGIRSYQDKSMILKSNLDPNYQVNELAPRRRAMSASCATLSSRPNNIMIIIDEDDIDCPPLPPRDNLLKPSLDSMQSQKMFNEYPPMQTKFTTAGYCRDPSLPPPLPPRKISAGDIILTSSSGAIQALIHQSSTDRNNTSGMENLSEDNIDQNPSNDSNNRDNRAHSSRISEQLDKNAWFKPHLTRKQTEAKLLEYDHIGRFLIRKSKSDPHNYALSLVAPSSKPDDEAMIYHYKILMNNGRPNIEGFDKTFDSVPDLVEYYSKIPDLVCALKP
ncbi:Tyrosine-protein phosphatase non-receptor type 6 [Trichoplax sp. H2]|nr:Tyrosine-protein phosphatase non-receptor type 6 [Trichoplax sp. H2]|eukprot:RDD40513.1 Tyrosine-protein phosphatase non-receptor type 6 [Trichoplax sp. H2]